jgi:pSer/pThr/pTyr-binding forkhead associated (FHA) protein
MLQASLKVIGGKNDGKLIEFRTTKFLVGREQDCHLRPNSDLVSRHHCVFSVDDYAVRLRDLGSTNGTLVNGRRIRGETVLTPGDVVKIGKLNLEVIIGDPAEITPPLRPVEAVETTTNATALDTAHDLPQQTMLEDSSMLIASSPGDSTQFEMPVAPATEIISAEESVMESDTSVEEATSEQEVDQSTPGSSEPVQPMQGQQPFPPVDPQQYVQGGWQYPQYYAQPYQFPPQGYPMGYPPPGYPPGYGYPPQGYPPNYQQPGVPQQPNGDPGSSSEIKIPDIRLPDPSETGVKQEPPQPAPTETEGSAPKESTPSERAAQMLNSRRRRQGSE